MGTTTAVAGAAAAAAAAAAEGGLPAEEDEAGVVGGMEEGVDQGTIGNQATEGEERQDEAARHVRRPISSAEGGLERTDGGVVAGALGEGVMVEDLAEVVAGARGEVVGGEEVAGAG